MRTLLLIVTLLGVCGTAPMGTAAGDVNVDRPAEPGLRLTGEEHARPISIESDPETMALIVNGERFELPTWDVQLGLRELEQSVHLGDDGVARTIGFKFLSPDDRAVVDWALEVLDDSGAPFRTLFAGGQPPASVTWDGTSDDGRQIAPGEVYRYRLSINYDDGARSTSAPRRFGINLSRILTLSDNAGAFEFDRSDLTERAKQTLAVAAVALRKLGDEPVAIEGHTDSVGSTSYNDALSRRRADGVLMHLIEVEGLPAGRLHSAGFGEDSPLVSNETAEGREKNRRVEICTDVEEVDAGRLEPLPPTQLSVRIDGERVTPTPDGDYLSRFDSSGREPAQMDVSITSADGSTALAAVTIPTIAVNSPTGEFLLAHNASDHGCTTRGPGSPTLLCTIDGRTDPGNRLRLDGHPVPVASDGRFSTEHSFQVGRNKLEFTARNPEGFTRLTTLDVEVSDQHQGRIKGKY